MTELRPEGRYAMLLRKSREDAEAEARGRFETLALHEAALTKLAKSLGVEISAVYRELVSGDRLDERPETMALLQEVARGEWDGVFAHDIQRISRGDMIDQGIIMNIFRCTRTLIVTPGKIFDLADEYDSDSVEMSLMMGRVELGWIKRRLTKGKEQRSQRGDYLAPQAPFGWEKCVVDHRRTLRPSKKHELLLTIYKDVADWRRTPTRIADDFNRAGIPAPRGAHWHANTVRRIVRNPVNIGFVRWNQKKTATVMDGDMRRCKVRRDCADAILTEGLHRGLGDIDDELFDRANRQLDEHSPSAGRTSAPLRNPLAGLLVCKRCGRAMTRGMTSGGTGEAAPGERPKQEWYVHARANRHVCHAVGAPMERVVELVAHELLVLASEKERSAAAAILAAEKERCRACSDDELSDVEDLLNRVHAEDAAVDNLFRLAERGMITDEEFFVRKQKSDERRTALMGQLEQLGPSAAGARMSESDASTARAAASARTAAMLREAASMLRSYEGHVQAANNAVRAVVERIEYERDDQTREIALNVILK